MRVHSCHHRIAETRASLTQRGFTLVELLVAMAIFVLLTATVLMTFQRDDTDRLSASGRTLQSYFEGARSRAINDGQVRGVRLIRSANDPALVTTLAYVGSPGFLEGECRVRRFFDKWVVINENSGEWGRLIQDSIRRTDSSTWTINPNGRSLITDFARIELPANSGQWYTVRFAEDSNLNNVLDTEDANDDGVLDPNENDGAATAPPDDMDGFLDSEDVPLSLFPFVFPTGTLDYRPDALILTSHYVDSRWNSSATTSGSNIGGDYEAVTELVPYRLELAPTILPNTEPVQLDQGIVIDLDASKLPQAWRPSPPQAAYDDHFDILFDSRGAPTGTIAASGLVHLYLTTTSDAELTRGQNTNHPRNATGPGPYDSWPYAPARPPNVPKTEPIVLSLFTQGGQVTTSNVDYTDNVDNLTLIPPADGFADGPFSYARRGQEAQ